MTKPLPTAADLEARLVALTHIARGSSGIEYDFVHDEINELLTLRERIPQQREAS